MKNFLAYFYNMEIPEINSNHFIYDDKNYCLEVVNLDEKAIYQAYNLSIMLQRNNIICNKIVLNIYEKPMTIYDGKLYVLMETVPNYNERITFVDVLKFPIKTSYNDLPKNNDWKTLWSNKNDYLEYQINQFGLDYPLLRESFAYFNGLSEIAVQILNDTFNNNLYIVHKRISYHTTYYDFYNPFNMVLDSKVRDIAEYYKDAFLYIKDLKLEYFFNNYNLTNNEKLLFLSRMLYPTFYYDMFEKIINKLEKEEKIKKIINNIDEYENLLNIISNYIGFNISWLKK